MKVAIVAGPPSSGKTAVITHAARSLMHSDTRVAAIKFDTQSSLDPERYKRLLGIPAISGISGYLCPDHFFVANMEEALAWGKNLKAGCLFIETAGLCLRCAPHIDGVLGITVIDCLGGIQAPQKMGPMLTLADLVVLTKGDLVSQAEREVIAHDVRKANPTAQIFQINGLIGTGAIHLVKEIIAEEESNSLADRRLRHDMPAAICSYCTGEQRIGKKYQSGNVEKIFFTPMESTHGGNT